jgi:AP-3 complex subunit delta-1
MSRDPIFQKSLQDVIKGIRSNKKDTAIFISECIAEIKIELRSAEFFLKAEAVRKLTYLQMLGYNIDWASFAIVEVMSQPRFGHKRIGYLAANQSFNEDTNVILLTTNLFKKEFSNSSNNQYEIGLAINSLANIANKELSRDLIPDLVKLMTNTKPFIRKKSTLAMFKLYVKFPQALRLTFENLKERLDDSESSVISTAVNVICELSHKNPRNYLSLAPKFFNLLTSSSNNWMLIKVVKLLGSLVSEEPRLARKLLEPLATIIKSTGAKSLQYECIYTVLEALTYTKRDDGSDAKNAPEIVNLCSDHLREFIESSDQNLKYLGLVGLVSLMRSNARCIVSHREIILKCLEDDDITIRLKSLELLAGIVSKKSLVDLVHHLLGSLSTCEGAYRDEVISKILQMCSKEKYSLLTDFSWYISILLDLSLIKGSKHGKVVADQMIEISIRVDSIRPFAVESMLSMLLNEKLIMGQARNTVFEVLRAAAWIIGEYSTIITDISLDNKDDDDDNGYWIEGPDSEEVRSIWRGKKLHYLVIKSLLNPSTTNLPTVVQIVYIHAVLKIFSRTCIDCKIDDIAAVISVIRINIGIFLQSLNIEVQERSSSFRYLLNEFNILPMNCHSFAEEEKINKEEETQTNLKLGIMEDLIDFPVFTESSVSLYYY